MAKVLFVCTGNICRSPTADGVFRARAADAGLAAECDSAATGDWHTGDPPDGRAIACARGHGVDLSGLRARRVTAQDFERFDLILGMDHGHLRKMAHLAGRGRAELALFGEAAGLGAIDVPDPYMGGPEDFEAVYALIGRGVDGLIARLRDGAR